MLQIVLNRVNRFSKEKILYLKYKMVSEVESICVASFPQRNDLIEGLVDETFVSRGSWH